MTVIVSVDEIRHCFTPGHMATEIAATDPFQAHGAPCWSGPNCHCGAKLRFEVERDSTTCHCPRCKRRSERDGACIFVWGHGGTDAEALANWRQARDAF